MFCLLNRLAGLMFWIASNINAAVLTHGGVCFYPAQRDGYYSKRNCGGKTTSTTIGTLHSSQTTMSISILFFLSSQ